MTAPADIIHLTAADLASRLSAGELSSVEATTAHLDRIREVDGDVHAFLHVNERASSAFPAGPAAVRPPRSPRSRRPWPSDPTPAGPSVSPHTSPEPWG